MNKTIVMIHGMWCGAWYWEKFKRYFEERGYQCHTPILRHHDIDPNDSPPPALGTTSLVDYAQDLQEYISGFEKNPFLMAHSMGGLLAQILAARGSASGLVLLAPASPSGINAFKFSVIKSFWGILTKWGFWRKPNRLSFDAAVYALLHLLSKADQKKTYEKFVYESGRVAAEIGLWPLDLKGASKVDESNVTCPVLVIAGTEDRITPAAVVSKVAEKYKDVSTYKEFKHHAHWLTAEPGWDKIAEYVHGWIKKQKK